METLSKKAIMNNFARFLVIVIATLFGFLEIGLINGSIRSDGIYGYQSRQKKSDYQAISSLAYKDYQKQHPGNLLMVVDNTEQASLKFPFLDIFDFDKSQQQFVPAFTIQKIISSNLFIKLRKIDLIFPFNDFW